MFVILVVCAAIDDYQPVMPEMEAVVLKNGVVDYYSALQVRYRAQHRRFRKAEFRFQFGLRA